MNEVSLRRIERDLVLHIDGKQSVPYSYNQAGKEAVFFNFNTLFHHVKAKFRCPHVSKIEMSFDYRRWKSSS